MQIRPPLTGFRSDKSSMEKGYPVITVTPIMSDAQAGFTREEVLTFRRAFRSGREFDAYRRTVRTQKHRSADRPNYQHAWLHLRTSNICVPTPSSNVTAAFQTAEFELQDSI